MRTCIVCNVRIDHRAAQARTCSRSCQQKSSRDNLKDEYNSRRRAKARLNKPPRFCEVCDVPIDHMHGKTNVCSDQCRSKHRTEYAKKRIDAGITQEISNRSYQKHKDARRASARSRIPKKGDPRYEEWAEKRSAYYKKNRADLLEKKKLNHSQHPEKARERSRAWREKNLQRARDNSREYSSKLAAALKIIKEIQTKGLEALL